MPESEFDKQVQQELQGLRLRPSAAVWENVEKELRRRKKRRAIAIIWTVVALGILGYSGYWLTQKNDKPITSASPSYNSKQAKSSSIDSVYIDGKTSPDPHKPSGDEPQSKEQNELLITGQEQSAEQATMLPDAPETSGATAHRPNGITTDEKSPLKSSAGNADSRIARKRSTAPEIDKVKKLPSHSLDKTGPAKTASTNSNRKTKVPVNDLPKKTDRTDTDEEITNAAAGDLTSTDVNSEKDQKPLANLPETPTPDSVASNKDSAVAKSEMPVIEPKPAKQKNKGSSKIRWSLDLAVGGSGAVGSPFRFNSVNEDKSVADLNALPGQGGLWPPVTPPGAFGPVYISRSDVKPGPAARVGVLAEIPLSKRISLSTGLQYQYLSNNIRIGFYKDTSLVFNNYASQTVSVRAVYQGGKQKTFTNRFHYLQVPVNFQWQMNQGKKLPLILNAGVSAAYLITSNGLVYDSLQGGIYYHDKNAFNRFQLNLTTGLSFRFGTNKALQWSIGPEFSMGLRKTIKPAYDQKQYPVFIGVQGRIYLPAKKK